MIVSEDNVSTALRYLAQDPHPLALARKDVTDAENEKERIYATVYFEQSGPIRDKELACELDGRVRQARDEVGKAELALDRHKARARAAEMLIEVWRSEQANVRAAEKIR